MASNPGRRPPVDEITWANTGAQDRAARVSKGDVMQDNSARESASGAAGFEGSFIDVGNTAINPSSTAKSGGSKGQSA